MLIGKYLKKNCMVKRWLVPYPTQTPNPTANSPHPTPPHTQPQSLHLPYPTLPPPHPTTTIPALPCPTIPYPTLPLYMLVRSDISVVLLSISVSESGLILLFRSVLFRSVKLKSVGTDRMKSVKSVDSMPELSKLYNCRLNKCRIVTC